MYRYTNPAGRPAAGRARPSPVCPPRPETVLPERIATAPIAMAYVPRQTWKTVYEPETALRVGTVFPELDLPLLCGGVRI